MGDGGHHGQIIGGRKQTNRANGIREFHVTFLDGKTLMHLPYDILEVMVHQLYMMRHDPEFSKEVELATEHAVARFKEQHKVVPSALTEPDTLVATEPTEGGNH